MGTIIRGAMGKGVKRELVSVAMLAAALLIWFLLWDEIRYRGDEEVSAPIRYGNIGRYADGGLSAIGGPPSLRSAVDGARTQGADAAGKLWRKP